VILTEEKRKNHGEEGERNTIRETGMPGKIKIKRKMDECKAE
jgi:hypothetical protein